jgi:uracil-DNA glycosylase family 4
MAGPYDPRACGALCDKCPLNGQTPVPPELQAPLGQIFSGDAVAVVGEAPNDQEAKAGRLFVGPSGIELDKGLRGAGFNRNQLHVTTVVLCNPPKNDLKNLLDKISKHNRKNPDHLIASPIDCCRPRFQKDIENIRKFIALGKTANQAVTGSNASIMAVRGALVTLDATDRTPSRFVMPTVSPGLLMHQMRYAHVFRNDLAKAGRWFRGEAKFEPPEILWHPNADQLREFLFKPGKTYAFDLETDGVDNLTTRIRCIGIGDQREVALVGLLGKDGFTKFYSPDEEARVLDVLREYFGHPDVLKIAHNGINFDAVVLHNQLGVRPQRIVDTMLLHKSVESELPHGLGYVVSLFAEAPAWKTDREGNKLAAFAESDRELGEYCLYEGTPIVTEDGIRSIEELVRNKYAGRVLSRNNVTGESEWKSVIGWHYNLDPSTTWVAVTVEGQRERDKGLRCTHDHRIIGPRGEIQAQDLQPGDLIYDAEPKLTDDQVSAILGTLVGDTILVVSPTFRKNKMEARTAALLGGHATASGLTQFKCRELQIAHEGVEKPARAVTINGREGIGTPFLPFQSGNMRQLADLLPLVYDNEGKRRLYVSTLEKMGPRGWAWWFMDDGCVQKKSGNDGLVISTQRYPREDVEAVRQWFCAKFGPTYVGRDNIIRMGANAALQFATAITPYLPPEARYKLPQRADTSFEASYVPVKTSSEPSLRRVLSVEPFVPDYKGKHAEKMMKYIPQRRYCLDVADNHNFFTTYGLVHNCALDVSLTEAIAARLLEQVQLRGQLEVWKLDQKIQTLCAEMHMAGMYVDQAERLTVEKKLLKRRQSLLDEIRDRLGRPQFNPNSTDQLRDLLFSEWRLIPPVEEEERLTKSGDPSTADFILRSLLTTELSERHVEIIRRIRYYRKVVKVLGTYVTKLRPWNVTVEDDLGWDDEDEDWIDRETRKKYGLEKTGIVNPRTGRMYPGYSAGVAVTGRLSSSKPINAQNFPKAMRKIVTAAPGNVLIGADMDQLELRIAAARWHVPLYIRAFTEGKDPHSMTAYAVFGDAFCKAAGIDPALFASDGKLAGTDYDSNGKFIGTGESKKMRDLSKAVQYASQYMAKVETVHKLIQKTEVENKDGTTDLPYAKLPLRQVREMHTNWLKGAPEFEAGWEEEIQTFRQQGYLTEDITFRRRDFLDGEAPNEIVNFPIQSTAAGLMNNALLRLSLAIPFQAWGPGTGIINQCHDAIVIECPADGVAYTKDENGKIRWDIPKGSIPWKVMGLLEECLNCEHPALPGVVFTATADIGLTWKDV